MAASANLIQGSTRVRSRVARAVTRDGVDAVVAGTQPTPYYESLIKLFPVEAVTLYPMALGVAGDDEGTRTTLIAIIALVVVGLRYFGTKPIEGGRPDWMAIIVALVSFLLYAAALGGFGVLFQTPQQTATLLSFLTVIWVAFVPYLLRQRSTD
ncbi:hypothetical protein [Sphingosinicella sp. LY1275]|uniref:hypothetical protein n=1 Tax=Sphingosinicella sp. LY1275 TaxID=3095379 RepID=UPI002ADEBFAA|nr:hypothetical protein [Sphingosinicella sp. LY1275]MEA1014595.1 hypothetical protein [Sphingosinicella sp. LY1275]